MALFQRRDRDREVYGDRLPAGQKATEGWPVLHYGSIPKIDLATWRLELSGLVEAPVSLTWEELLALPQASAHNDIHCVTAWSKFDNEWEGVPFRVIADRARPAPEASHVMVLGDGGYTTNVPLRDLLEDDVLLADTHAPEPLTADHGAPLRLIVPKLYAWKSAKWLRGFDFMAQDRAGYWERVGYHMYGDPFREQRYS
jgi:DMSO/TMAO reductase YedYZ molybdopterin-dependent catalytic subunit